MPQYEIISSEPYKGCDSNLVGQTLFNVILKADSGYAERQQYVGDETTLQLAAQHQQKEIDLRLAKIAQDEAESAQAMASLGV